MTGECGFCEGGPAVGALTVLDADGVERNIAVCAACLEAMALP